MRHRLFCFLDPSGQVGNWKLILSALFSWKAACVIAKTMNIGRNQESDWGYSLVKRTASGCPVLAFLRAKEPNHMSNLPRCHFWRVSLLIGNDECVSVEASPEKNKSSVAQPIFFPSYISNRFHNNTVTPDFLIHEFLVVKKELLADFLTVPNRRVNVADNLGVCADQNAVLLVHRNSLLA